MLELIDVFQDGGNEYYGILDGETNMLVYVTYYDLQKKYHNNPITIEGVKYTNLNSVGLKLTHNLKSKLYNPSNRLFTEWLIKPFVEYDVIKDYTIKKMPYGYRILKGSVIYTFQNSSRMGICWRAHLCFPMLKNDFVIRVEKTLLGYPVLDLSNFFEEKAFSGKAKINIDEVKLNKWKQAYLNKALKVQQSGLLDFSQLDFTGVQDITDFLKYYGFDISLPHFDLNDVRYCSRAFCNDLDIDNAFQVIDLSNCTTIPFVLSDEDVFIRRPLVQLFLISNNEWLLNKLNSIEAINLGFYTDREQPILSVKKQQGSFALMNRPFVKRVYYAVKQ